MVVETDRLSRIMEKYGRTIDPRKEPQLFAELIKDVVDMIHPSAGMAARQAAPFGVSWMDSWVAHWVYAENLRTTEAINHEFAGLLRSLVDLKVRDRLNEIRKFIQSHRFDEPPDGGPPEPGTPPPAGPARFEPPDGGPPEPGVPPDPPAGPESGFIQENPWILYWFLSIK